VVWSLLLKADSEGPSFILGSRCRDFGREPIDAVFWYTDIAMQDPGASAMVRAIIGIARELGIEVIAQGVETEAQRGLLIFVPSTTKVQGYYYSAPVTAVHATELLRQRLIEPRLSQVSSVTAAQ